MLSSSKHENLQNRPHVKIAKHLTTTRRTAVIQSVTSNYNGLKLETRDKEYLGLPQIGEY